MGSLDRRQSCGWSSRLPHELRRRATLVAVSASLHSDECRGESELRRKKDRSIEQTKAQEEKKSMTMKVRRIVTGHNVSGKAIVKTDEQVTAVSRVAAGISGCEIWSTDQCQSTTRRPLTPPNGRVSSSTAIMWATVGARRSGSTSGPPAMRDSRTEPKPWTT